MSSMFHTPRICVAGCQAAFGRGARLKLASDQIHRLETVMRRISGDKVRLFDGFSGEWSAVLDGNAAVVDGQISQLPRAFRPAELKMLVFGRLANREAVRDLVSAAVQLGADILLPVVSARSQRRMSNARAKEETVVDNIVARAYLSACAAHPLARSLAPHVVADSAWPLSNGKAASVIIEACEQSERLTLPLLLPAVSLSSFAAAWDRVPSEAALPLSSRPLPQSRSTSPKTRCNARQAGSAAPSASPVLFPRLEGLSGFGCAIRHAVVAHEVSADARSNASGVGMLSTIRPSVQPLFESVRRWRRTADDYLSPEIHKASDALGEVCAAAPNCSLTTSDPSPTQSTTSSPRRLLAVLVGPEGGWGPADKEALSTLTSPSNAGDSREPEGGGLAGLCSGAFVSLGRNVLRAETAALAALAIANAALEH